MEPVCQYLRNVSKIFQNDISSRTWDIPLSNFNKEVSKQTDWQTYMKFRIICNKCTNIPGMSPKDFRKISHPGLDISLYLSNFSKEVSQLTDWHTCKKIRKNWSFGSQNDDLSKRSFRNWNTQGRYHRKLSNWLFPMHK